MDFEEWKNKFPEAAFHLKKVLHTDIKKTKKEVSETRAQQEIRMEAARTGGVLWRNNVGAVYKQGRMVRFGLANDSEKLNEVIKSSDLIGIKPIKITKEMIGKTIGQFWAVEVKKNGVVINLNNKRHAAQAAYGALVTSLGGYFEFSYGNINQ